MRYFSRILFKGFRGLPSQITSLYIYSNSKQVVLSLFKIIQNYVNNKINNKLFHDEGLHYIETSPLNCSENQWTGFYMIEISVMKELKAFSFLTMCFYRLCLDLCYGVVACVLARKSENRARVQGNTKEGDVTFVKNHQSFTR